MSCGWVAKALAQTIDHLLGDAVRERLLEAVFQEPEGPDDDGLAHYTAWWAVRDRVDRAIEGTRACRTILQNLRDQKAVYSRTTP